MVEILRKKIFFFCGAEQFLLTLGPFDLALGLRNPRICWWHSLSGWLVTMDKEKTETPQRGTCAKQSSRIKINSRINPRKWLFFGKEAFGGVAGI
jgi:hypothetical protein